MAVRITSSKRVSAEEVLALQLEAGKWTFTRQHEYAKPRRFKADFLVRHCGVSWCDVPSVLVEVQGGIYSRQAHGSVTGVLADLERGNAAAIAGYRVIRVTPQMVDDGTALQLIEKALER